MLLLKLACRPWKMTPFSQLFSGLAVGFLLLMAGLLFWMQQGLKPVVRRLQQEQVITAYLAPSVETADESKIVDQIKLALGAHAERSDVELVERSQFVNNIKKQYPDLGRELEDLGADTKSVVPRYVSVSGLLIDGATDRIRAIPGIESADSSRDRYHHILGAFSALRWVAKLLVGGLALALLTGLIHLARNNAYIHRDAVALMRLMGAGSNMLQAPGIISGALVGLFGGAIAFGGWATFGLWLTRHLKSLSPMLREMPAASPGFGISLLITGTIIGLAAGIFGAVGIFGMGGSENLTQAGGQLARPTT